MTNIYKLTMIAVLAAVLSLSFAASVNSVSANQTAGSMSTGTNVTNTTMGGNVTGGNLTSPINMTSP
jgi:hypothetical protein